MFFYAKKIIYLSLFKGGEKISSAGFASMHGEKDELCFTIQIKNVSNECEGSYTVYLITKETEADIGKLSIQTGSGDYKKSFACSRNKARIGNYEITPEDIYGLQIRISDSITIEGEWKCGKTAKVELPSKDENPESDREPDLESVELKAVAIPSDKWEQLKAQYKTVHPFGDEREFISIELKDFVVLREKYQKLVNNSFLLHGFYNYRHLILGKDYKIGTNMDTCFYLGVPGVFFEREKMVAVMFGFEGFEAAGPIEIGKFGYYLRSVEI